MSDNTSLVITILIVVILIVLFPLYNIFSRQDEISNAVILKATTNFVDKVKENGYIDLDMYESFINDVSKSSNSYDIELEAHRKMLIKDVNNAGEYIEEYKIDYTDDILKELKKDNKGLDDLKSNIYKLNKEDEVFVRIKNTNTTVATNLINFFTPVDKKDAVNINYGGVVKNTNWKREEYIVHSMQTKANFPILKKVTQLGAVLYEDKGMQKKVYLEVEKATENINKLLDVNIEVTSENTEWWLKDENQSRVRYEWIIKRNGEVVDSFIENTGKITRQFIYDTTIEVRAINIHGVMSEPLTINVKPKVSRPVLDSLVITSSKGNSNNILISPDSDVICTMVAHQENKNIKITNFEYKVFRAYDRHLEKQNLNVNFETIYSNKYSSKENMGRFKRYRSEQESYYVEALVTDELGRKSVMRKVVFVISDNTKSYTLTGGDQHYDSIEIPDCYVTGFTFDVEVSGGHSGSDSWYVIGAKDKDSSGNWIFETLYVVNANYKDKRYPDRFKGTINNGPLQRVYSNSVDKWRVYNSINASGTINLNDKYKILRFFYHCSHPSCLQGAGSTFMFKVDYTYSEE